VPRPQLRAGGAGALWPCLPTFIVTCVPSCCSLRELLLARVAVRGPGARLALAGRGSVGDPWPWGGARETGGYTLALLAQSCVLIFDSPLFSKNFIPKSPNRFAGRF